MEGQRGGGEWPQKVIHVATRGNSKILCCTLLFCISSFAACSLVSPRHQLTFSPLEFLPTSHLSYVAYETQSALTWLLWVFSAASCCQAFPLLAKWPLWEKVDHGKSSLGTLGVPLPLSSYCYHWSVQLFFFFNYLWFFSVKAIMSKKISNW